MILVTVGTERYPFDRLMQWLDQLVKQNLICPQQEEIIVQYGSCTITTIEGITTYSKLKVTDFHALVNRARIIVAHCGEGTLDLLASINKPFILVPRSHSFQEHVDNHQVELANQLAKQGVPIANSPKDLVDFLANPTLSKIPVAPTEYYERVSLMLEEEFEKDSVLADLTWELVGSEYAIA